MNCTRRDFGRIAAAAFPMLRAMGAAKPNSVFRGVHIGIIAPYSFRGMSSSAEDILKYLVELGLSTVELQSQPVEAFAGAPAGAGRGFGPPAGMPPAGGPGGARAGAGPGGAPGGAPQGVGPGGPGQGAARGPRTLTPEQQEAMKKAAEQMRKWRLSVSMDKFRELRKVYNEAGVAINAFKLEMANLSDEECDYGFNVARALGATHVTMELNLDPAVTERIGKIAARHQIYVGYHNHTQVKFNSWDVALAQSPYNGINFDVGHYAAATNESPIPFIRKYANRIQSLHLKDRKYSSNGGANLPWGQGDSQLKEILQLLAQEKYSFPANIEFEYPVPEGSTVMAELARCIKFAKDALS